MSRRSRAAAISGLAWFTGPAFAASAYLGLPISVRQAGMGGVVSLDGDLLRAWSHPALLADQTGPIGVGVTGGSGIGPGQVLVGVGAGLRGEYLALGILASSQSLSLQELDEFGDPTGAKLGSGQFVAGIVSAARLGPLQFGISAKSLGNNPLVDTGMGMEVGILLLVVSADNWRTSVPPTPHAGMSYSLPYWHATMGAEYVRAPARTPRAAVGADWWPSERFGLRAGVNDIADSARQYTLGLSGKLHSLCVDYAFVSHPVGTSHRAGLSWAPAGPAASPVTQAASAAVIAQPSASFGARLPPVLAVSLKLTSARGQALEADEAATLVCTIKNSGRGAAEGVTATAVHRPQGDWLQHTTENAIGRLEPGQETTWEIPLAVSRRTEEGTATFDVAVKEANGFDADPAQLNCATRAFKPPHFVLRSAGVNDATGGLVFGNGNGKIEPGETVELTLKLANTGEGPSRGTAVRVVSRDPNVVVQQVGDRDGDRTVLGDVTARGEAEVRVNVLLNRRFPGGGALPCDLELSDSRPGLDQRLPIPLQVAAADRTTRIFGTTTVAVDTGERPAPFVIAVMQLKEQEPLSRSDAANLTEELQAGLVNLGYYRVVERTLIERVLQEQALQQTGCTSEGCSVKLGKLLNAQRVVTGTTGKFGGNYIVSVRVINVETGEIILQERALAAEVQALLDEVRAMAERLGRNMR